MNRPAPRPRCRPRLLGGRAVRRAALAKKERTSAAPASAPGATAQGPGAGGVTTPGQQPAISLSTQRILFSPRYGKAPDFKIVPDDGGDKELSRLIYTGGLIVNVRTVSPTSTQVVELAADNVVAWIRSPKGKDTKQAGALNSPLETAPSADGQRNEVEVYLQGNVVIRTESQNGPNQTIQETLFAAEAYYDTNKNRAVALEADLDLRVPFIPDPCASRPRRSTSWGATTTRGCAARSRPRSGRATLG